MENSWLPGGNVTKLDDCSSKKERDARSVALEKTYVHEPYQQIALEVTDSKYRAWPRVKQFIIDLEPGSLVCDVGCGNGKYLGFNPYVYKIGLDRCSNLISGAREKNHEVLVSDNLALPFRDECLDAVLSIAVIHHFATTDRRVQALQELARVLRIGGRILVSAYAAEQRHRKFESQDILIPWTKEPLLLSSTDEKTSSIERDFNSTTTSDEDATHYHAYTQTSDSDSFPSLHTEFRKRARLRHRGRSIDPGCPSSSQSSSDLSSPNESCYSFLRHAFQKLAGAKRNRGGRRPWFLQGLDIPDQEVIIDPLASMDEDEEERESNKNPEENLKEDLKQLDPDEFVEFLKMKDAGHQSVPRSMLFSTLLHPRRRRTLETTCELHTAQEHITTQPKSKSLSDLFGFGFIPLSLLRGTSPFADKTGKIPLLKESESHSSLSNLAFEDIDFPDFVRHKSVQTDDIEIDASNPKDNMHEEVSKAESIDSTGKVSKSQRPILVKQKASVCSDSIPLENLNSDSTEPRLEKEYFARNDSPQSCDWDEIKDSIKNLPEFKRSLQLGPKRTSLAGSSMWKQSSLNEELVFSERLKEKEMLKQNIQKQYSLNEELICERRENTRWVQMKEAFLNSPNVKCIQQLKTELSNRFRGTEVDTIVESTESDTNTKPKPNAQGNSIRNGLVRMLQNWKQSEQVPPNVTPSGSSHQSQGSLFLNKKSSKGLFPPFFLRRSSAGSLNLNKKDATDHAALKLLSPPPYLSRRPSENELINESGRNGSKLIPGVRHVRKLSREEGSDSSKDSSFQSDTSVDSEDSFASVIFIPKNVDGNNDTCVFTSDTRANSTDSDRSPKSPALHLSPRRKSPISPTRLGNLGTPGDKPIRFLFDETATKSMCPPCMSEVIVSVTDVTEIETKSCDNKIDVQKSPKQADSSLRVELLEDPTPSKIAEVEESSDIKEPVKEFLPVKPRKKIEKIEVLRKPGNFPTNKAEITRKLVRRSLPKALAVELYNPETDDADTSDSSSSSNDSVSSVVSVENVSASNSLKRDESSCSSKIPEEIQYETNTVPITGNQENVKYPQHAELPNLVGAMDYSNAGLPDNIDTQVNSSPRAQRKLTLSKLGSTSDWLAHSLSLSSEPTPGTSQSSTSTRIPTDRRHIGEKILLGEVKKMHQKGPDAKWPSCIIDESPPSAHQISKPLEDETSQPMNLGAIGQELSISSHGSIELSGSKLLEENDDKDSMFDSMENLSNKQQPSRNPSIDSSIRMSSTCSCSIRGDSFESWTSAKSSLTNSSSTQHKNSLPSASFPGKPIKLGNLPSSSRIRPESSKSSSAAGEDVEDPVPLTYHRYYHVFREGELDKLIEKYVQNLHIISSYYDHANWCIIAEKVQVWTI